MPTFSELLQQGTAHAWLFIPSALLLGALHGLEPGHSKTMMAAFIVAVRGSVGQAVLLGLSAALSHTIVVWAVALVGLYYAASFNAETSEPYFQLASAALVIGIAAWILWRTWRDRHPVPDHDHSHGHDNPHGRGEEARHIDTGHGKMALEVHEHGVPPHFRISFESGHGWRAAEVTVE